MAGNDFDAIVIGGGFYGCTIAEYLARRRGASVALLEREPELFRHASHNNQARIHNGYHYPRSFTTAFRSRVNFPGFLRDWPESVHRDFTALYAIARRNSKVTATQFARFCREIGAPLRPAMPALRNLFDPRLIEAVFEVEELAFDASRLATVARRALHAAGVQLRLGERALGINRDGDAIAVDVADATDRATHRLRARMVFNCTYSGLAQFPLGGPGAGTALKHEITEMALARLQPPLDRMAVTVMDGPFFSLVPFPSRAGLHTLSHVRYTPHLHWLDAPGIDPYARLAAYPRESRADRMLRDAARYLPTLASARSEESLFEVKTVLVRSESDDGRPILFDRHPGVPGCYSVLGGKIDNIADVLERLQAEPLAELAAGHLQEDAWRTH